MIQKVAEADAGLGDTGGQVGAGMEWRDGRSLVEVESSRGEDKFVEASVADTEGLVNGAGGFGDGFVFGARKLPSCWHSGVNAIAAEMIDRADGHVFARLVFGNEHVHVRAMREGEEEFFHRAAEMRWGGSITSK